MLGYESCILRIKSGQCCAPSGSRTWDACRRIFCTLFEIGFGVLSHLGEVEIGIHTTSSTGINDGPFLRRCSFHSDCCFDHSVSVPCLDSRKVAPGCEKCLHRREVVRSFSNELFQVEFLRSVLIQPPTDEYPRTILEVLFHGIKTTMECTPTKYVVVLPSKHIQIVSYDHREVVCTLCIQVLVVLNNLSKVESRSIVLFQLVLKNPSSCHT